LNAGERKLKKKDAFSAFAKSAEIFMQGRIPIEKKGNLKKLKEENGNPSRSEKTPQGTAIPI
jgi:hypothetical protein